MLLDVAIGGLVAAVLSSGFGAPLTPPWIALHVLFALLPDADFIYQALRRKSLSKVESSHRYLLHNPMLYIPLGFAVIMPFSFPLACSFAVLSFLHFAHDSVGLGWGVRWLYPFSKRSYKFFSDHDGSLSSNPVTSWSAEEENQLEVRANPDQDWLRRVYLRPHPISLAEHALTLLVALGLLLLLI